MWSAFALLGRPALRVVPLFIQIIRDRSALVVDLLHW